MKINIDGYKTSDGSIVVYEIPGKSCYTLNLSEINRILNEPLKFGDRMQIHALKSWTAIEEYRKREREYYATA